MSKQIKEIYEFGEFRFDAAEGLLFCGDREVQLTPKAIDLLLELVQSGGRVLSKEELMQAVWADSFVEEVNLAHHISVLRKVLGDGKKDSHYIETLPRRGYRFVAKVNHVGAGNGEFLLAERVTAKLVLEELDAVENEDEERPTKPIAADLPGEAHPALPTTVRRRKMGIALAVLTGTIVLGTLVTFLLSKSTNPTSPTPVHINSIAVLPFKLVAPETGEAEMEYLSDGISESLINRLSQLPGMKVIARSSSFKYKGKDADPQEVAQALGVEMILTGNVWRRNEQLQISVELIKASDKTQIWGEQYDRRMADLLPIQAEISREIAEKLRLKLTNAEQQQLARRETVNPQAYELLLKRRFCVYNKSSTENRKKAMEYYQQAIALDPAYSLAYAELSFSYCFLLGVGVLDPKEFTPKAEAAALYSLQLDDSLAEAHLALAVVKVTTWVWAAAEREYNRAIELNPNLAIAHQHYGFYLSLMGRHDEAIAEAKRARDLDPLSLGVNWSVGYRYSMARRNDEAIEVARKLIEMDQNYADAFVLLGYAYDAKGQYGEAIAAYQTAIKLGNNSPDIQTSLGAAYANAGEREKARSILKRIEAEKYLSPCALASFYLALDEREQAFAALERAYTQHDSQLPFLGIASDLDPLRSDPRFAALLRRIGLTP